MCASILGGNLKVSYYLGCLGWALALSNVHEMIHFCWSGLSDSLPPTDQPEVTHISIKKWINLVRGGVCVYVCEGAGVCSFPVWFTPGDSECVSSDENLKAALADKWSIRLVALESGVLYWEFSICGQTKPSLINTGLTRDNNIHRYLMVFMVGHLIFMGCNEVVLNFCFYGPNSKSHCNNGIKWSSKQVI